MSDLRLGAVSLVLFVLLSCVSGGGIEAVDVEDTAVSAIAGAEEAVAEVFDAVLDAEDAGANVSDLLNQLNVAAEYLTLARVYLRMRNFEGAVSEASLCVEALEGALGHAEALRDEAVKDSGQRLWRATGVSVVGVVVVASASFLCWRWLRKRYYRRVLEMKAEVAESEF